jgi:hypothetical protein
MFVESETNHGLDVMNVSFYFDWFPENSQSLTVCFGKRKIRWNRTSFEQPESTPTVKSKHVKKARRTMRAVSCTLAVRHLHLHHMKTLRG